MFSSRRRRGEADAPAAAPDMSSSPSPAHAPPAWSSGPLPPPAGPPVVATAASAGTPGRECGGPRRPAAPATLLLLADDPRVRAQVAAVAAECVECWRVVDVDDPLAAIEALGRLEPLHVLVAQASIAGAPTDSLLERVRDRSPQTARIVLVDTADREAALRVDGLAHQILPIDLGAIALAELLDHVRSASESTLLDPVRSLVGRIDRLPSPPTMYQRIAEILATSDWSLNDLADEVTKDVGLTGEMLKLVNSPYYGSGRRINSVSQAIALVGIDITRTIVLGNQMYRSRRGLETWIDLERLAGRSYAVAHGARNLALRCGEPPDMGAITFLSGMVSEIGLLVLARIPDISPSVAAPVNVAVYLGAERALFGGDRFEVGAQLLTLWGFDATVVDAVRRLSTNEPSAPGEVAWYLAAARQLVLADGIEPGRLATPDGVDPQLDAAVAVVRTVLEPASMSA